MTQTMTADTDSLTKAIMEMTSTEKKIGELVVVNPQGAVEAAAVLVSASTFQPSTSITAAEIEAATREFDLTNTNSITRFGSAASESATAVSRQMLDGVRNKDTGPAGDVMSQMMLKIRGMDSSKLAGGGLFGWLKSRASRLAGFMQEFEEVSQQIEAMSDSLRHHQITLMTSVAMMDRLYDATVIQFHNLEVYILAGEQILHKLNTVDIPALREEVTSGKDGKDGTPASLMPQKLNDLIAKRDQMERKVHDLKLVRMVSLQALPKIRLTQDSDNSLIAKIDTIVATTIPIWYQEIAINMEIAKTQKAADATTMVADATEEMLVRGAEQFKTATISAKNAVERSVVGIDAIKKANDMIIQTLEESVSIVQAGKRSRAEADRVLLGTEQALRDALNKTAAAQAAYDQGTAA